MFQPLWGRRGSANNLFVSLAKLLLGGSRTAGATVPARRARIDRPRTVLFPLWHPGHRATLRPPRRSRVPVTNRPAGRDPARCRSSTNQTIKSSAERPTRVRAADGRENAIARAMVYVLRAAARSVGVDTRPGNRRTDGAYTPATERRGGDGRGRSDDEADVAARPRRDARAPQGV